MTDTLASTVVHAMERLDSTSAAVVKRAAYLAFQTAGINVDELVKDARRAEMKERQRRAAAASKKLTRLEEKAGKLQETQAVVATKPGAIADKVRDLAVAMIRLQCGSELRAFTNADIACRLGVERSYVKAVLEYDAARAASREVRDQARGRRNKQDSRVSRLQHRPHWDGPTAQRITHARGEKPTMTPMAGNKTSHRFEWPIDDIKAILTEAEYAAAERLRKAFDEMGGRSMIGAYGGLAGGSDPARKLAIGTTQEYALREYRELWSRVAGQGTKLVLLNFCLQVGWGGSEDPMGTVEFGRRYSTTAELNDKQARGIAHGAVKTALSVLHDASASYSGWVAAQRRGVDVVIGKELDILANIAAGVEPGGEKYLDAALAMACDRTRVAPWIVRGAIMRLAKKMAATAQGGPA